MYVCVVLMWQLVSSIFPPCLSCQVWGQVSLSTEPFCWPINLYHISLFNVGLGGHVSMYIWMSEGQLTVLSFCMWVSRFELKLLGLAGNPLATELPLRPQCAIYNKITTQLVVNWLPCSCTIHRYKMGSINKQSQQYSVTRQSLGVPQFLLFSDTSAIYLKTISYFWHILQCSGKFI